MKNPSNALVFALPGNESFADRLARELGAERGGLELRRFPDEEAYLRLASPDDLSGRRAIVVCSLDRADRRILPLLFLADALREHGSDRVLLAAPYLAYMRQDRRFRPGEAVTSTSFARLLSSTVDGLVTVDPHLHRRASLGEIYTIPSRVVHAAPLLAQWIARNVDRPLLIGPDAESAQWVEAVARDAGAPFEVLEKVRRGDRSVSISLPHVDRHQERTPVLVDDIVSTGRTMIETASNLKHLGLGAPVCVGVHAVFATGAAEELAAVADRVATCNTITHPSNAIDVAPLVAAAVERLAEEATAGRVRDDRTHEGSES